MQHPVLDQIARTYVIEPRVAPAAVLGVASHGSGGWRVYTGAAGAIGPTNISSSTPASGSSPGAEASLVTPDTVFDLASVSKPFLAVLVTRLARRGTLHFDTPLGALLAEARGTPSEQAPIEALLAHRAGLEAHLPLFGPLESRRPVRFSAALVLSARSVSDCRAAAQPLPTPFLESAPLYSDLGYLLVGAALERVTGRRLDQLLEQEIFAPLALDVGSARQWLERGDFTRRVAPTESLPWRGRPVRGRVHDDNCWALAGHGCAGHAGLFAPVTALLNFGCTLIDAFTGRDESYLGRAELDRLTHPRPGGTLRCGFDGKALEGSSAGTSAGPRTFGHLGFTGTSLWCDPDAGAVVVMLTNRVHPTRENPRIRVARPLVHEALFRLAQSTDGLN